VKRCWLKARSLQWQCIVVAVRLIVNDRMTPEEKSCRARHPARNTAWIFSRGEGTKPRASGRQGLCFTLFYALPSSGKKRATGYDRSEPEGSGSKWFLPIRFSMSSFVPVERVGNVPQRADEEKDKPGQRSPRATPC